MNLSSRIWLKDFINGSFYYKNRNGFEFYYINGKK